MQPASNKSYFMIALGLVIPMIAVRASRDLTARGYKLITHEDAPRNPGAPNVQWSDALVWAAVSGLIGGLTRVATLRWLAATIIPSEGDDMEHEVVGKFDEIT